MKKAIEDVLHRLDDQLIGLDEQKRQLKEVLRRWRETGKGDSCLVTGTRGSGRTAMIEKLLEKEKKKTDFISNPIYVAQLGSDATAQDAVSEGTEEMPRVVVISDADELVSRQRQTLLYSFLDATRRVPWLVILMVNRHDFVSSLEKRVRSRLSTAKIVFTGPKLYSNFQAALSQFLRQDEKKSKDKAWNEFVDGFLARKEVQTELNFMFQVANSYGALKTVVAVFLGWLADSQSPEEEAVQLWRDAVATIVPTQSPVINLLNGLSLRTYSVFLCVLRRLKDVPPGATVAYQKIWTDYMNLSNRACTKMRVEANNLTVIYKELDQLVRMRILSADTRDNNIAFRRVSLHADSFILTEAVKTRKIPYDIYHWFESIPTN